MEKSEKLADSLKKVELQYNLLKNEVNTIDTYMYIYRAGNNSQTSDIFWPFHAFVWSKDYWSTTTDYMYVHNFWIWTDYTGM